MSISCNAVRDVFVLYEDGALSDETQKEVKAHLSKCRDCRGFYREMKSGYARSSERRRSERKPVPSNELSFESVAKKLHRAKIKKDIISNSAWGIAVLGGVLITVAAYRSYIKNLLDEK